MAGHADHAIVIAVIAKCPIAGQCKTRLNPFLNADGSALLARAMLLDVLTSISRATADSNVDLLLFYAPPTEEGRQIMQSIIEEEKEYMNHNLVKQWTLVPVNYNNNTSAENEDTPIGTSVQSSNLSNVLANAVHTAYQRHSVPTTVVLMGMDAPEVPLAELHAILTQPQTSSAVLCPAEDGGYVLLSLPPCSRSFIDRIFQTVHPYWSHPLTALAQIKSLSDVGISTIMGPLVADIDTPEDVQALIQRLRRNEEMSGDIASSLHQPSVLVSAEKTNQNDMPATNLRCPHTRQALIHLQLLLPKDARR